jgi:hypothetical protein
MNTKPEQASREHQTLVELVDFKWLMAGVGWWVDLSRLQRDKDYADECLHRAVGSGSQLLRERAAWLLRPAVTGNDPEPRAVAALAA